jgi:PIN domain nuclease of toxin-antitoxin system
MRLLLDSHAFLWSATGDTRLSARARSAIEDPDNDRFLSVASAWELMLKVQVGKLKLPSTAAEFFRNQLSEMAMESLPVLTSHVMRLEAIPLHHRDPFDRLLIAQSQVEGLAIVTADPAFALYEVDVLW